MVYQKSALGLSEFTNSKRSLGVRERQVLLLVNGERNLEDLEKFFRKELLDETIDKLATNGFIYLLDQHTAVQPMPQINTQSASLSHATLLNAFEDQPIQPEIMHAVKALLLDASDDYLGLMGRGIKEKIAQSQNLISLRAVISAWHMAMRESKLGRESTDFLMMQIHQTLESNPQMPLQPH